MGTMTLKKKREEVKPKKGSVLSIGEAVRALAMEAVQVDASTLRRWDVVEGLVTPAYRLQGTLTRAYTKKQLHDLKIVAIMKAYDFNTLAIKHYLAVPEGRSKDELSAGILKEIRRIGALGELAEEVFGAN